MRRATAARSITVLTAEEVAPWRTATEPVIAAWQKQMKGRSLTPASCSPRSACYWRNMPTSPSRRPHKRRKPRSRPSRKSSPSRNSRSLRSRRPRGSCVRKRTLPRSKPPRHHRRQRHRPRHLRRRRRPPRNPRPRRPPPPSRKSWTFRSDAASWPGLFRLVPAIPIATAMSRRDYRGCPRQARACQRSSGRQRITRHEVIRVRPAGHGFDAVEPGADIHVLRGNVEAELVGRIIEVAGHGDVGDGRFRT